MNRCGSQKITAQQECHAAVAAAIIPQVQNHGVGVHHEVHCNRGDTSGEFRLGESAEVDKSHVAFHDLQSPEAEVRAERVARSYAPARSFSRIRAAIFSATAGST